MGPSFAEGFLAFTSIWTASMALEAKNIATYCNVRMLSHLKTSLDLSPEFSPFLEMIK